MPILTHICHSAACDVCGEKFDEENEYTVHFESGDQARDLTADTDWTITADGRVVCDTDDDAHQARRAELTPPEPEPAVPHPDQAALAI